MVKPLVLIETKAKKKWDQNDVGMMMPCGT